MQRLDQIGDPRAFAGPDEGFDSTGAGGVGASSARTCARSSGGSPLRRRYHADIIPRLKGCMRARLPSCLPCKADGCSSKMQQKCARLDAPTPVVTGQRAASLKRSAAAKGQERESSDSPMLNAFCRVAPSVLFNFLAILDAGVFLRAIVFSSRTSLEVHARRFFDLLAIEPPFQ